MNADAIKQLNLLGDLSDQVNSTSNTGHKCLWHIYWTKDGKPLKECLGCRTTDEIWPPKDQELISRNIALLVNEVNNYAKLAVKQPHREETLKASAKKRYDKIAQLKNLLERYGIDPDLPPHWEDTQTQGSESVLGVNDSMDLTPSTELTPSTVKLTPSTDTEVKEDDPEVNLTPSTKRRSRYTGSGYIYKRTRTHRGKILVEYWYCYEEGGLKRSRYIARSLEAEITQMNQQKRPVKEILQRLNSKPKK